MSRKLPSGLTEQQERFCQEFLKDVNGTQAAIRAGYGEKGAAAEASRLLRNPKIQDRCQDLANARAKRVEVDSDEILAELKRLGYSDIRGIYDELGAIKKPRDWPKRLARAVAGIEVREEFVDLYERRVCEQCNRTMDRELTGYTKKVKFWDKPKGLELLGKHKKLFTEKHELAATGLLEDLIAGSMNTQKPEKD